MRRIRRSNERGHADHGWLKSHHTFSFAGYYDPEFMGFGPLRVINDDRVSAGRGFGTHPHNNMEIISYVVEGELEHKDSMGNGSIIRPGEIQRMSAGTGVTHSEYNPSKINEARLLQIWVIPDTLGITPEYEQKFFGEQRRNRLCLVASQDGAEGSVTLHQDVNLYASVLDRGHEVSKELDSERIAWIQVVSGAMQVGEDLLEEGDALAITGEQGLTIAAKADSEFLFFDMKELSA